MMLLTEVVAACLFLPLTSCTHWRFHFHGCFGKTLLLCIALPASKEAVLAVLQTSGSSLRLGYLSPELGDECLTLVQAWSPMVGSFGDSLAVIGERGQCEEWLSDPSVRACVSGELSAGDRGWVLFPW